MFSMLNSGMSGHGASPILGNHVVFLDKTLHFHSAFLHPYKINPGGNLESI